MKGQAWEIFAAELSAWRDAGRLVEFWWRDDDAGGASPALTRLFGLASRRKVPLALAAVPDWAERAAFEAIHAPVTVIQHGSDHTNRAAPTEKKTEFPATEPVGLAVRRLLGGRAKLEALAGDRFVPVLAPPWNRLSPALLPQLSDAGFLGYSAYGVRKVTYPAPGVITVNTHVDIVDWKGTRGFVGIDAVLAQAVRHLRARRTGLVDPAEPTGWLTHHAVHDEGSWAFMEDLFDVTQALDGIRWCSPADLFGSRSVK